MRIAIYSFSFVLFALIHCLLAQDQRPNIIFIMSDDHAQQAISAYGDQLINTPNIDRIANEGIRFANSFVTNSICAPSRAVLLTGKYSHLNRLRDNRDTFDGGQMTFPKLLQKAGYQTAIAGKWHLKSDPTGFDEWRVLRGQGEYYNPTIRDSTGEQQIIGYVSDVITDLALDALENRDREKPFCLLVHHKAPHRNWMPDTKHLKEFSDINLPLPATFYDDYSGRESTAGSADMRIDDMYLSADMKLQPEDYASETGTGGHLEWAKNAPRNWKNSYQRMTDEQRAAWDAHYDEINEAFRAANLSGNALLEWKYQRYVKDYLRCIRSVDDNVGRLLQYLDENGLADNTVVIYTSDQGFYLGEHGWYDKRFMYEESMRTPLVVRMPGQIRPGEVSQRLVSNLDWAPTILSFAGVEIPDDMQGQALQPLWGDHKSIDWRSSLYYHYYEYPHGWHTVKRHYGVRTDRYKLIHFYHDVDTWELFDLQADPAELKNLYKSSEHQEVVKDLKEELKRLQAQFGDTNIEI